MEGEYTLIKKGLSSQYKYNSVDFSNEVILFFFQFGFYIAKHFFRVQYT